MNQFDMRDYIENICSNLNFDLKIKIQVYKMYFPMRYERATNNIIFHPERVSKTANKMNIPIEKFLLFGTLHELGHHIDNMNGLMSTDKIRNETVAWENSRKLISDDLLEEYDEFNKINLNSYRIKLNR